LQQTPQDHCGEQSKCQTARTTLAASPQRGRSPPTFALGGVDRRPLSYLHRRRRLACAAASRRCYHRHKEVEAARSVIFNETPLPRQFPPLGLASRTVRHPLMQGPITVYEVISYAVDPACFDLQPNGTPHQLPIDRARVKAEGRARRIISSRSSWSRESSGRRTTAKRRRLHPEEPSAPRPRGADRAPVPASGSWVTPGEGRRGARWTSIASRSRACGEKRDSAGGRGAEPASIVRPQELGRSRRSVLLSNQCRPSRR